MTMRSYCSLVRARNPMSAPRSLRVDFKGSSEAVLMFSPIRRMLALPFLADP